MAMKEEVTKTYKMLKESGFDVADIIFEGAITIKGKTMLDEIEELAIKNKAKGMIRVLYSSGPDNFRQIEIPVGELVPEEPVI